MLDLGHVFVVSVVESAGGIGACVEANETGPGCTLHNHCHGAEGYDEEDGGLPAESDGGLTGNRNTEWWTMTQM